MSQDIEIAISTESWDFARKLILGELKRNSGSHWLLTRLALTYYEQFKYEKALSYSLQALEIEPNCPLALWDAAGALAMLGRNEEAIEIYRKIIRRGVKSLAHGDCGEGIGQARGLVADSWYRIALCQKQLGLLSGAKASIQKHLSLRGPGCRSIYEIKKVKRELVILNA